MNFQKIHNKGQATLFKNQYVEYLTKSHPLFIFAIYVPVIIFMPYYSFQTFNISLFSNLAVFISGMFFWTFTEYLLHRFAFHHHPKTEQGKKINYLIHGNHHEYPRDKERLFMPPIPSIIISSSFLTVFYLCLGNYALTFHAGFILGYLIYGSMHYAIHAWNPPFKWMKPLWRNHHLHHYKHTELGFGVSTTLWDRVFGTMYDLKNEAEDKEKVKELMY